MLNRIFFIALTSIAAIATAIAYGIGGQLAIDGTLTVGTLLAITALLARLYGPLTALSNVRVDIMSALVSFERVFEVLDLKPMVQDKAGAIDLVSTQLELKFDSVSFSYPSAGEISIASLESVTKPQFVESGEILKGISFIAAPNTMTGVVGVSGSGKTTLSSLIPRLYDVTTGSISLNGIDIRDYSISSLRKKIGVVTQDAHLFHDTILSNLLYANSNSTVSEIEQACNAARIWDFIQTLPNGLETIVGERGHRLSGGEKQRLAIARLLLRKPSLVILDEATAHLDSENESLVQAALKEVLVGRTSIVIAHRLSTIMQADQILVIDSGRIIERGNHDQLVKKRGAYFELYEGQNL
jgi:ATP-binding cassette subfamily B protein